MRGIVIVNGYVEDEDYLYQPRRMQEEFAALRVGTRLIRGNDITPRIEGGRLTSLADGFDFCLFWDKDAYLLRAIERSGLPIFNAPDAIRHCDDKFETLLMLASCGIPMPTTLAAPLCYRQEAPLAKRELDRIERALGFPLVVKRCFGSRGDGVSLVHDRAELRAMMEALRSVPHLYQQYVAESYGRDLRVMVVGGRAVGAMLRRSEGDFRSNIGAGGSGEVYPLTPALRALSEKIAAHIAPDYCGIDFLFGPDGVYLLSEVNSNAFFSAFERVTAINVAALYAKHIVGKVTKRRSSDMDRA